MPFKSAMYKYEPCKGDWKTPNQREASFKEMLNKLEPKIQAREIKEEERVSYFGVGRQQKKIPPYDALFHMSGVYNPKAKREDRTDINIIHENIYREEQRRTIPVVTSHLYGHSKTDLEGRPIELHKRLKIMDDNYRRYGINLKPEKKLPNIAS